jgi:hypothetical protein
VWRRNIDGESELHYEGAVGLETEGVVAWWGSDAEAKVFAVVKIGG